MKQERAVRSQGVREESERFNPLREDQGLSPAFGNLGQVGLKLLELDALAGQGVKITDLLEPQHQLEDVLNGNHVTQVVEVNDPFIFCPFVSLALGNGQLQKRVSDSLRWKI